MPGAVQAVVAVHMFRKTFFPVKKHKLQISGACGVSGQNAGCLQNGRSSRCSVIGSGESVNAPLGVNMAGQQASNRIQEIWSLAKTSPQVDETDGALGRFLFKILFPAGPAVFGQFLLQVCLLYTSRCV